MGKPENTSKQAREPKRDARGKFKKGASGNPGGRPAVAAEVKSLAQKHGSAAIARLAHLMNSADLPVAIAACKVLLDRGYGRAEQSLTVDASITAEIGEVPPISSITDDPLEAARIYEEVMKGRITPGGAAHYRARAEANAANPRPEPPKPSPPKGEWFPAHPATRTPPAPGPRREPETIDQPAKSPLAATPPPAPPRDTPNSIPDGNMMALLAGPAEPPPYVVVRGPRREIPADEGAPPPMRPGQ